MSQSYRFDLRILEDWKQTVEVEPEEMTPTGPYSCWEICVMHPVELRKYWMDLKRLETHWRIRVYYKDIRTGHRFMKAIHPTNLDDVDEAKFLALKHLTRYFEEQLALYNAVCIIHLGRKHTEVCDCDDSDHSQHLETEQRPLMGYDGMGFARKAEKVEGEELCEQCLGTMDLEAFLKWGLCPYCRSPLPHSEEEYYHMVEKGRADFQKEYKKTREELQEHEYRPERGLDAVQQPRHDS